MQRQHLLSALLAVAVLGTACASGGSSGSDTESPSPAESPSASRSRNVITREEIVNSAAQDPYQAVRRLRSSWLRVRGAGSTRSDTPIMVFVNNVKFGPLQSLQSISIDDVQEIRFFNARDATTRWGTGVTHGAIEVITR